LTPCFGKATWPECNEYAAKFGATPDEMLRYTFAIVRTTLRRDDLERADRNGEEVAKRILDPGNDLQTRLRLLPRLLDYDEGLMPSFAIGQQGPFPDFLERQVFVKVVRQEASLLLIEARRQEALQVLAASYRMGQFLNAEFALINRLIGIALRVIACQGLQDFALNACETEQQFRELWGVLTDLERVDHLPVRTSLNEATTALGYSQDGNETPIREAVSDAKFELMRMATAAKCHQVLTKTFPAAANEFTPLLPQGPPVDPFTSQPLRFDSHEPYRCYSLGPDKKDQHGRVTYDSTNGTVSAGDIVTTISRERVYPFPQQPLHASSHEDVLNVFTNGLPVDVFADRRGQPMGITQRAPVRIWSAGPDTDSSAIERAGAAYLPTVQYDPTNGTISQGDVFIELPPK
jgi:hypothetical protein